MGSAMAQRASCPPWCSEHASGAVGVQHRVVIGDVRLTRTNDFGVRRTTCAVRRRVERTPEEMTLLCEDLVTAGNLLRYEHRRLREPGRHDRPDPAPAELAPA